MKRTQKTQLQIEHVAPRTLLPHPRNPRTISSAQMAALERSITPCYPMIHRRDAEGADGCAAMADQHMITAQASLGMSGALLINRVLPCDEPAAAPTPSTSP
jgi:hypothetical protein